VRRPARLAALSRRTVALSGLSALCLAGLLGAGLVVAGAGEGADPATASTATSAEPSASGSSGSGGAGDDNTAVAVNTRDGSEVYAVRLKVVVARGETVDATNAAVAAASCNDCQTVAIALEGVLVTGDAEVVAPENVAIAINSGCDGCATLAYAYQNVQTTDGMVRLTGEGRKRIAELRRELNGLRNAGLDIAQIRDRVSVIAAAFADVLRTEVVAVGPAQDAPAAQTAGTASPTASASPTAPATGSASPSPSASASPSASPSPTPTVTASASP